MEHKFTQPSFSSQAFPTVAWRPLLYWAPPSSPLLVHFSWPTFSSLCCMTSVWFVSAPTSSTLPSSFSIISALATSTSSGSAMYPRPNKSEEGGPWPGLSYRSESSVFGHRGILFSITLAFSSRLEDTPPFPLCSIPHVQPFLSHEQVHAARPPFWT